MILFFGPPGSGKSVQGELLVKRNSWQWLSTGQLFRESKDAEVLQHLASGELIDDELTNKVLNTALGHIDPQTNIVLDGYPRNVDQEQWLVNHLPEHDRQIDCVVAFKVPKEEIISRLAGRGRAEDTPEVIERRLDIYQEKTKPVLDYFKDQGITIAAIDGHGSIETVHERLYGAVEACIQK